jgi:NADPH-dependent curcumin reductase CurA
MRWPVASMRRRAVTARWRVCSARRCAAAGPVRARRGAVRAAGRFAGWLRSGAIQFPHAHIEGIEQAPQALHDMLAGRYLGTVIVAL